MPYLPPFVNRGKRGAGRTFSAPQPDQPEAVPANVDEAVAAKEKEPDVLFAEPEVAAEQPKPKTPKKPKKPPTDEPGPTGAG